MRGKRGQGACCSSYNREKCVAFIYVHSVSVRGGQRAARRDTDRQKEGTNGRSLPGDPKRRDREMGPPRTRSRRWQDVAWRYTGIEGGGQSVRSE